MKSEKQTIKLRDSLSLVIPELESILTQNAIHDLILIKDTLWMVTE